MRWWNQFSNRFQCDLICAKIRHYGNKNKVFGNSWKVYLVLGKILSLLWLCFMLLGKFSLLLKAKY